MKGKYIKVDFNRFQIRNQGLRAGWELGGVGRLKQTCDVDLARQGHVGFAHGAEQSAVVDQPCDAIVDDEFPEKFVVQHVSVHKWA